MITKAKKISEGKSLQLYSNPETPGQFGQMFECSFKNLTSDFAPASSKEFLDIQATIECGFTLELVRDMTRTYQLNERKLRFFSYWYIWKNCNSYCELCLAWCGRKLLSSKKIAEFLENWKINFTLLWYRAKEGEMWYALQWYQVLEPRLHLMYIQYTYTFYIKGDADF